MRDKFNIACRRSEPCAALPGTSMDHVRPVLEELRARPLFRRAADSDGKQREFSADASQLAIVMYGGSPALATVRELDAAARAFTGGDRAPLLRLMAETATGVGGSGDIAKFSAGLAVAVMCQDAPQIFDMRLPPLLRAADRDRAVGERKRSLPDTYAPFTIDEYRGMPLDYSFIDQCIDWPAPPSTHPASHVVAADARYPDVPGPHHLRRARQHDHAVRRRRGGGSVQARHPGAHCQQLPRQCPSPRAQRLRRADRAPLHRDPGTGRHRLRGQGPASAPGAALLAVHAAELEPAEALPGNGADAAHLRWVSAAVMTAGDVLTRVSDNSSGTGVGLRGGTFRVAGGTATHVSLSQVRFTEDLAVSGDIDKTVEPHRQSEGELANRGPRRPRPALSRWNGPRASPGPSPRSAAVVDGAKVLARTPAP